MLINVFEGTVIQRVKFRVESDGSQVCSLRFDLFHEGFQLGLNLVYLCLQLRFEWSHVSGRKMSSRK